MINFQSKISDKQDAIVLCLSSEDTKKLIFPQLKSSVEVLVRNVIKSGQFDGSEGSVFPIAYEKSLVLLCGLGAEKDLTLTQLRVLIRKFITNPFLKAKKSVTVALSQTNDDDAVRALIEGLLLGGYCWNKYKSNKKYKPASYTVIATIKPVYKEWVSVCGGVNLARDLVNDNADVINSEFIEKQVRQIIKGNERARVEVLNTKELKANGLNLHLAVNQGSPNEPKLVIVKYTGAGKNTPYTALIGKGMTFDTGGLNLKPTGSIETMKMDMGGAAAVLGTLYNTINLNLKANVIFAVGLAENVTGSRSYKPGDVFTGCAGKSVEVANTDAEGRLVLADAIAYVQKNYKPRRIIDIATLTGACIVGLGYDHTGLVSTDDDFADKILQSAIMTDDWVWRLPSYPQLKEAVKSQIADIKNLGYSRGAGGAITAAEFLRQFVDNEGTSWAHLDIAGTCYAEGHGRLYFGFGATGSGVRLLTDVITKV